ncbi:MAG TPA: hypothetical protein VIU81_01415 [Gaiellaceae bacterium]
MLVHSIQAYGSYAVALERGKQRASLAALDDADNTRFKAFEKLAACGYLKHGQSIGLDVQAAYQRLNRAATGIENCQTRSCLKREGRKIARAATAGIKQIRSSKAPVEPKCLRTLVDSAVVLFRNFQQFGRAAQMLDVGRLQSFANRIGPLQARMARQARQCVAANP